MPAAVRSVGMAATGAWKRKPIFDCHRLLGWMRDTWTPVKVEVIEDRLRSNSAYVGKFQAAMPGAPINMDTIARALAEFERSLEPSPADFDRWVEGDEGAISEQAKRGFVLFNTKATCFVCHIGWRSPTTASTTSAPRPPIAVAGSSSKTIP